MEGIISKNKLSPYTSGRNRNWLKTKCSKRQEFLVVGYTAAKGNRDHFSALLLAAYNKRDQLLYCGKVGTGFNAITLKNVKTLLNNYKTNHVPFKKLPSSLDRVNVTWITPKVVVEVEFTEWTRSGVLRHPSFKGLRNDKRPSEVIKESF